jgi:exopolysaccharide biosynthesis predicted pyruvyltransferase EpsI
MSPIRLEVEFITFERIDLESTFKHINQQLESENSQWQLELESVSQEQSPGNYHKTQLTVMVDERFIDGQEQFYQKLKGLNSNFTVITNALHEHFAITAITQLT